MFSITNRCRCSQSPTGALEHVLQVLKKDKFKLLFEEAGMEDIYDFMSVEFNDLKDISCLDYDANVTSFNAVDLGKMKKVLAWYHAQSEASLDTWYDLNDDVFKKFIARNIEKQDDDSSLSTMTSVNTNEVLPGIKRSISDYPKLRENVVILQ